MPSGSSRLEWASMAISWIVLPFSGSPFTCQRPSSHSRSSGEHSSAVGGDDPGLVADTPGDDCRSRAGHRRRTRAVGAEPERCVVGVAVDDLDVLGRDADLLGDDLGERRLVALALALHRQPQLGLAGGVDAELAAVGHAEPEDVHVLARAGADTLGEERQADAHQLAVGSLGRPARRAASA